MKDKTSTIECSVCGSCRTGEIKPDTRSIDTEWEEPTGYWEDPFCPPIAA